MNTKILGFILAAVFTAETAQAVVIDDFDGGAQSVSAPGSSTVAYVGAIGGFRKVEIAKSGLLGATAAIIAGVYSHSADALTSATSKITWDASGAGLGGVNLLEGLINNIFSFDILTIDQGNLDLILSVADTIGGSASFTLSGAGVGNQTVDFSNFIGVDFSTVDLISLEVVGGIASDLTLDSFQTKVPEPTSLALLAGGLASFGFGRRKAK